jgi:TonB family protein
MKPLLTTVLACVATSCATWSTAEPCPVGMVLGGTSCWTPKAPSFARLPQGYEAVPDERRNVRLPHEQAEFTYAVHRRIHPRFSDTYLEGLEGLPSGDPVNRGIVFAVADIRIRGDGSLEGVQIWRSSGFVGFDGAVVTSVQEAAPYPAPPASVLHEGHVTLRWIFSRPETLGCSAAPGRV